MSMSYFIPLYTRTTSQNKLDIGNKMINLFLVAILYRRQFTSFPQPRRRTDVKIVPDLPQELQTPPFFP